MTASAPSMSRALNAAYARRNRSSAEGAGNVRQILEGRVLDALPVQIRGEPVACEHARGRERSTAIRVPVACVDHLALGQRCALAALAARVAHGAVAEHDAPARGTWLDPVRKQPHRDALPLQYGLDQLVEGAGEDERVMPLDQLVEPRPDACVREHEL